MQGCRSRSIIPTDDLEVGDYVAIHSVAFRLIGTGERIQARELRCAPEVSFGWPAKIIKNDLPSGATVAAGFDGFGSMVLYEV